jgi:hypothetical protein
MTDRSKFRRPEHNPILDWLAGKRPEDLAIIEHEGTRLYPDTLKRRTSSDPNELEIVEVLIRPPTSRDKAMARLDALQWALKLAREGGRKDLPPALTIQQAEAMLGATYFDELDTKCLVARCTHNPDPPHDQYLLPWILDTRHEHGSIMDLWDRISFWYDFTDVRVDELDDEQFLQVLAAIDTVRNVTPLLGFAGAARDGFVTTMARQLLSYRTPKS